MYRIFFVKMQEIMENGENDDAKLQKIRFIGIGTRGNARINKCNLQFYLDKTWFMVYYLIHPLEAYDRFKF